ncbi:hypothetical protein F5B22DRAFT_611138 [Xylaria bambusicola]|uniref:uncharacterized protein n=1 Tax=Xylaria bambusicola TaxID=326684 RepID=UPI002007AAFE|nr:uncharacterized protein F5B22DRAFT_611138 [Xylaria bambusicola]KAI0514332.1 hypothetical protein F5B22DRAFT_611138 [Xylaria bambusicola]
MGSQLVQAQWSLNETSVSVYSIARGVLEAATSDNVQPLAIMACEQFGNTLAISRETRLKIERTVLPTPEPVTIQFLKAKVGFKKHDCAVQLGSNQAGLRFLALAAALISSVNKIYCADALMLMLEETTSDNRLLPTRRHLADLMSSLEARCRLSGFSDVVFGYNSIIIGASLSKGFLTYKEAHHVPDAKGLAVLVDACRRLQRVGEHEISSINVKARSCAAWIAAFSKWSLELPPSIELLDGTPIVSQPGSKFIIIVDPGPKSQAGSDIEVTTKFKLRSLQDLVFRCASSGETSYRITFRTYGQSLLDSCGPEQWAKDAVLAALPLSIKLICNRARESSRAFDTPSAHFTITQPNPFPSIKSIFRTMTLLFDLRPEFPFDSLASTTSFRDLPEVNYYLRTVDLLRVWPHFSLKEHDIGPIWTLGRDSDESLTDLLPRVRAFISVLRFVSASLLMLSLFDSVEDMQFIPPDTTAWFPDQTQLFDIAKHSLINMSTSIGLGSMWRDVLKSSILPENDATINYEGIVLSSTPTHVVWPSLLDEMVPTRDGICRISSCPGRIMYEREDYDNVYIFNDDHYKGEWQGMAPREPEETDRSPVQGPWASMTVQWELFRYQGCLYASQSLIHRRNPEKYGWSNTILGARLPLLINCDHPKDSPPTPKAENGPRVYATPSSIRREGGKLNIFPVSGVPELQLFVLGMKASKKSPVAIRQRACFDCCIEACNKAGIHTLII